MDRAAAALQQCSLQVQLRVCKYCLQNKSKHQRVERKRSNTNKGLIFSPTSCSLDRNSEPESPLVDPFSDLLQVSLDLYFSGSKVSFTPFDQFFCNPKGKVLPKYRYVYHVTCTKLCDGLRYRLEICKAHVCWLPT